MDPRAFIGFGFPTNTKQAKSIVSNKVTSAIAGAAKNTVFGSRIGLPGDLAALQDLSNSVVGKGLQSLAKVSSSINKGIGVLPQSILSGVNTGRDWVLENVGITQGDIQRVVGTNKEVAEKAMGQASNVFSKVKEGVFFDSDIPGVAPDFFNVKRASQQFEPSFGGFSLKQTSPEGNTSPYAIDLAANANLPKYKFLFLVQFVMAGEYSSMADFANGAAFVVKSASRPKVKYDMDDVNYYNFRSNVITKITHDEASIEFYDAGGAGTPVTKLIHSYLRAYSPVANLGPDSNRLTNASEHGFDFTDTTYSASRGLLVGNQSQIFKELTLYHVYDYGASVNVYHYFNPRFTSVDEGDLDMTSGDDVCTVKVSFNYDSVFVEEAIPYSSISGKIRDLQGAAVYKLGGDVGGGDGAGLPQTMQTGGQSFGAMMPSAKDMTGFMKDGNPLSMLKSPSSIDFEGISDQVRKNLSFIT